MDEIRVEEYASLRQEILSKDEKYHEYKKFSCTVTTAILAFALTQKEPFICLVPLVIILSLFFSAQESLMSMLKIGAYLCVFYDEKGFYWEKRNMRYSKIARKNRSKKRIFIYNAYIVPYISLIIVCCLLSMYKIIFDNQYSNLEMVVRIIIVFVCTAFSLIIMRSTYVHTFETRSRYISLWNNVKKDELKHKELNKKI